MPALKYETFEEIKAALATPVAERARNWNLVLDNHAGDYLIQETRETENEFSAYPVIAFSDIGDACLISYSAAILDGLEKAIESRDGWSCFIANERAKLYFFGSSLFSRAVDTQWFVHDVSEGYQALAVKHMSGEVAVISSGFYMGHETRDYIARLPQRMETLQTLAYSMPGYGT